MPKPGSSPAEPRYGMTLSIPLGFWMAVDRLLNMIGLEIVFARDLIEGPPENGYRTYSAGRTRMILQRDTGR